MKLGNFFIKANFYILPLEGYEVVMGTQWLCTPGEIMWDFSKQVMKFYNAGNLVILKGLSDHMVEGHELE